MKHTNFRRKHIFNYLFPDFLFTFLFYKFFDFHPPENGNLAQLIIKITELSVTLRLILQLYHVLHSICYRLRTTGILKRYHISQNHLPYPYLNLP